MANYYSSENEHQKLKIIDGSPYEYFYDDRKNPIQLPIDLALKSQAVKINLDIPGAWHNDIYAMAKKLKIHPEFLYRKAIQAFFAFNPAIFDDDGYLDTWRQVFELDGEEILREHIQEEDDQLTRRILRARDRARKKSE